MPDRPSWREPKTGRLGAVVRRITALLVATIQAETAGCKISAGPAGKIGPAEVLNSWLDQLGPA
jgi:hypothetical protein